MPEDYLPLSHATNRLADGMWGGLPRPEPVVALKQGQQKLSVGFGPWREQAAECLRTAAIKGELVVYVVAEDQSHIPTGQSLAQAEPVVVPVGILSRLLTSRGGLPDHPIRALGNGKMFALLKAGLLVLRTRDFEAWYQLERAKGKWASQRSRKKSPEGRPTKQTEALRNAVLGLVRDLKWSGRAGISALHRLLIASGRSDVPSPDTLARLVDQMHQETGEAGLRRIARVRRTRG
jgi:hypothetical protein